MLRQPLSFLITILPDEADAGLLCGRIRDITSDEEQNFRNLDELSHFLQKKAGQMRAVQNDNAYPGNEDLEKKTPR